MSKSSGVRVGTLSYGKGVFAERSFSKGDLITVIEGEVIDDADYSSDYCMDLGGTLSLEPKTPFRFLNHGCEPNAALYIVPSEDSKEEEIPVIILEARRKIRKEDQITIDYGWPADHAIPCLCQSKSCRGWIVDKDQLEEVLEAQQDAVR